MRLLCSLLLIASLSALAGARPAYAEEEEEVLQEVLPDVLIVSRPLTPTEVVKQHVVDAARLLQDVPLHYTFVRKFGREVLRGRPVMFAAWSNLDKSWHVVEIEIPFPAPRWRPGGRSIPFRVLTPGFEAEHVRGVGTERLMFQIFRGNERLPVFGRKYPVIDTAIAKKKGARTAVELAEVLHYMPLNEDAAPLFIPEGRAMLRATADAALLDLRNAKVPSFAYPDKLLADTVLPETLVSLAVIEQTDDYEFAANPEVALNNTVGQYGLMQQRAFTYSVSTANAIGPMQFTDRRGRGTYSGVVRLCAGADLDPDFYLGARDLHNAMKAAACLLDLELGRMPDDVQRNYQQRPEAVSIFQVAAYNGGGRNASRLLKAVRKISGGVADLRLPDGPKVSVGVRCPCLWLNRSGQASAVPIPRYNRENMGYVDKYQRFMSMIQGAARSQ